jgi:hypothetical protein
LIVNLVIAALVLLLFAFQPSVFRQVYGRAASAFRTLAGRPVTAVVCAAVLPLLIRLAMLPVFPIPFPRIHDEFSYLLASDTFAHGRLTNPTHPLWEFFETFHVLQLPSYMSKYPPVQGLLMALGQVLFGHPWWGVVISIGIMSGSMCWMLRAWLPPAWALLGALAVGLQFGVTHYWMNSYWGGAPAAIGGCLLLGSYGRLRRFRPASHGAVLYGCLLAVGFVILLNSRPWEGMLIALPVACGFCYWLFKDRRNALAFRFTNVVLPCAAVLLVAAAGMLYYCWRITGNPLELPYTAVHKTYSTVPLFLWQKSTPPPQYHHAVMEKFYTQWEPHYQSVDQLKNWHGWLGVEKTRLRMAKNVLFGDFFLLLCCVALPFFWPKAGMRNLLWILAIFSVGLAVEGWCQIHYFGPVLGVAAALKMESLRRVSAWKIDGRRWGSAISAAIVLCSAVSLILQIKPESARGWSLQRAQVQQKLENESGTQLVVVRYSDTHNPIQEWVYNKADIDASKVVWAREMSPSQNQKLFQYFKGRHFWLLQPDVSPDLQPIPDGGMTYSKVADSAQSLWK